MFLNTLFFLLALDMVNGYLILPLKIEEISEINADVVMKATKVDGVYDCDPNKFQEAKKYSSLSYQQVLSDEIAVMDSTAIALCKDNNIPIIVFPINKKNAFLDAIFNKGKYTIIK